MRDFWRIFHTQGLERRTFELVLRPTRGTAALNECRGQGFRYVEEEILDGIEEDIEIAEQEESFIVPVSDMPAIEDKQNDKQYRRSKYQLYIIFIYTYSSFMN